MWLTDLSHFQWSLFSTAVTTHTPSWLCSTAYVLPNNYTFYKTASASSKYLWGKLPLENVEINNIETWFWRWRVIFIEITGEKQNINKVKIIQIDGPWLMIVDWWFSHLMMQWKKCTRSKNSDVQYFPRVLGSGNAIILPNWKLM